MKTQGKCPICLKDTILIEHHWYEDNTRIIGHIRLICHHCNLILRTIGGDNNHVLPNWDKQIEYARGYVQLSTKSYRFNKRLTEAIKQKATEGGLSLSELTTMILETWLTKHHIETTSPLH